MDPTTYTSKQIEKFYERIDLPQIWRRSPSGAMEYPEAGRRLFLEVLQKYTLTHIPFENLELHYSRTQKIDIHPEAVFQKIVSQGTGRGGYCFELNTLFATVLRTLGFRIYSTAARVNSAALPDGEIGGDAFYYGFGHMVNVVKIAGIRYLVDVGFGAGGLTKPLAFDLTQEPTNVRLHDNVRLRWDTIPENESRNKLWVLERKIGATGSWSPCYCFPDQVEFLYSDFLPMNEFASSNQKSFFKQKICVVQHILSDDKSEVEGELILFEDKLHRRLRGERSYVACFEAEETRIQALQDFFGIRLDALQRSGIAGMSTWLDNS